MFQSTLKFQKASSWKKTSVDNDFRKLVYTEIKLVYTDLID